ncbi:unnamed protein product [Lactuca saligna]|uniref:FH2 domain-containing protein n=1 Tax=Lactuca saligna TaxID=75948 RepID=A0AA35ZR71_LACSI|nr:unnamed protein product [Lactuca saligna]
MQTIVTLGNALNQGTTKGATVWFRLDSLLLLGSNWVLVDKLPELLDFSKDLDSLEPASRVVQLKYLAEEMQAISKGLEKVVQELSMAENDGLVSEKFLKLRLRIIIKQKPCVGVGPLCNAQQVKLMEERNMKPLDLNLAALSARCSKDLELNLAKSLLSEMGQCTIAYPYNQLFGTLVLKNHERQDATLLSWNLMYIVD